MVCMGPAAHTLPPERHSPVSVSFAQKYQGAAAVADLLIVIFLSNYPASGLRLTMMQPPTKLTCHGQMSISPVEGL